MKKDFSFEIKRTRRRSKLNKPSIWKGVDLTAPNNDDAKAVTETPVASGDSRPHAGDPEPVKSPPRRILPVIDQSGQTDANATADQIGRRKRKHGE